MHNCYIVKIQGGENLNKYLLEQLYKRYYKELYLYIYTLSSDCTVTDDIIQDTFLKALLALKDSHTNMRAWLYMVARNLYFNYYRKAKSLTSLEAIHTEDAANASTHFIKEDVLEELLQKEATKQLWEAIHHLKGTQKEVILLQYFGDFSQKEIAAMLRLSTGSVKMLAYRAKKELKEYLLSYQEGTK